MTTIMEEKQLTWQAELLDIRLPRWDQLPDIDLYMDQLVTLVDRFTRPFKVSETKDKIITASMVNNYVKHNYLLPPEKKRYDRRHLARLIILTILKQSFDLPVIQIGIQSQIDGGDYTNAYNQFCKQLEDSIALLTTDDPPHDIVITIADAQYHAVQMATLSLAAKLITEKKLSYKSRSVQ